MREMMRGGLLLLRFMSPFALDLSLDLKIHLTLVS